MGNLNYGGGLIGLIVLVLVIWAIVVTLQSGEDSATKLLWIVVLVLLPIIGLVLWWLLYPGRKKI